MKTPRYFVVVFGNPDPNGAPVESGIYTAGDGYPPFSVEPEDMLLLYCTDEYPDFPRQVPGIGKVLKAVRDRIDYRWMPIAVPISKETLDQNFESDDRKKMKELRFKTRRVFEISRQSFSKALGDQMPELTT
jgi:hypothetical protein